jgi:hypothetical protein
MNRLRPNSEALLKTYLILTSSNDGPPEDDADESITGVVSVVVALGSGSFGVVLVSSKDAVEGVRSDNRILLGLSSPSSSALRSAGVG